MKGGTFLQGYGSLGVVRRPRVVSPRRTNLYRARARRLPFDYATCLCATGSHALGYAHYLLPSVTQAGAASALRRRGRLSSTSARSGSLNAGRGPLRSTRRANAPSLNSYASRRVRARLCAETPARCSRARPMSVPVLVCGSPSTARSIAGSRAEALYPTPGAGCCTAPLTRTYYLPRTVPATHRRPSAAFH